MKRAKKSSGKKARSLTGDDIRAWKRVAETVTTYPGKKVAAEAEEEGEPAVASPQRPAIRAKEAPKKPKPVPITPLVLGDLTPLDKSTAGKFRKGQLGIHARLDLHGMRQEEAATALYHFIRACYEKQKRCVLVITGKGRGSGTRVGVLQQNVPRWLAVPGLRECIVAATHASARDGGEGALYIFIRRIRSPRA